MKHIFLSNIKYYFLNLYKKIILFFKFIILFNLFYLLYFNDIIYCLEDNKSILDTPIKTTIQTTPRQIGSFFSTILISGSIGYGT